MALATVITGTQYNTWCKKSKRNIQQNQTGDTNRKRIHDECTPRKEKEKELENASKNTAQLVLFF